MKKIILEENIIKEIVRLYTVEMLGAPTISNKIGIRKSIIIRILKENGVNVGIPGRKFIGGKKVSDKKYREKNKEKLSNNHKNWSEKNREHLNKYHKEWREKNIDRHRKNKREYERTRKANDPIYKLISNFRTAIYQVLKENNVEKNGHYFEILNYSPEQLISHLEKQFKNNMSWENYGEWHVDHIKPISSFNINEIGDKEFMECWNLNNLQPLWGEENIRKSDNLI